MPAATYSARLYIILSLVPLCALSCDRGPKYVRCDEEPEARSETDAEQPGEKADGKMPAASDETTIDNYELSARLDKYIDNHDSRVLPVLCYIQLSQHLEASYALKDLKSIFIPLADEFAVYMKEVDKDKEYAAYLYAAEYVQKQYGALVGDDTKTQTWETGGIKWNELDDFGLGLILLEYGIENSQPLAIVTAVNILADFSEEANAPLFKEWSTKLDKLDSNPRRQTRASDQAWYSILFEKLILARDLHRQQLLVEQSDEAIGNWDALCSLALYPKVRRGDDWPAFLGPTGDGKSGETGIFDRYQPGINPRVLWQRQIGPGFGACSVANGQVYLFDQVGDQQRLRCLHATTGNLLWDHTYPIDREIGGGYRGPRCSPVVKEIKAENPRDIFTSRNVWLYDETGRLTKISQTIGASRWEVTRLGEPKDLLREFKVNENPHGVAATPVIVGDRLFVVVGRNDSKPGESSIVTYATDIEELENSKELEVKEQFGNYRADYSTPKFVQILERRYGFAFLREGLMVFNAEQREVVDYIPWQSQESLGRNIATPVVVIPDRPSKPQEGILDEKDVEVFISTSDGKNAVFRFRFTILDKFGHNRDNAPRIVTHEETPLWQAQRDDPEQQPTMGIAAEFATPIYHQGFLYGCSGRTAKEAELRCVDWETGKVQWSKKTLARTSLLYADQHFVCLDEYGKLFLFKAGPSEPEMMEWKIHAELPPQPGFLPRPALDYPCWSAPVLSRGLLYVRGKDKLVCLDVRHPAELPHEHIWSALSFLARPKVTTLLNKFLTL